MTTTFDRAFDYVIGREGHYDDDPKDDGNWTGGKEGVGELKGTKYGISAAAYPHMDIAGLTLDQAKQIYRTDYWNRVRADILPPVVSLAAFDCAVNQGVGRAVRCLQRAAGVADDGRIGPVTLAALDRMPPLLLLERFQAERILEYTEAARWPRFKRGWMRRLVGTTIESMR